ncbi:protein P200 [Bactrocera oleae]|uniref:protein P200 n=1 Tax=Bactrocera oleae TaxID=104688 RepID=UPI00387E67BE
MSGGSQIKTTITTAVTRTEMSHIHDTAFDKDRQDRNAPEVTKYDASNLEHLKRRGDVKRKIIELENTKNTIPTSTIGKQKSLAEIGEKIPAVKEVVKDFEDKFHDYSVETTPFKVRQRDLTPAHVDENALERQILTDVDLALEKLISHEQPAEEVKLSPVAAIETRLDNSHVPKEEICEKVCIKRKMFEVAKDETKFGNTGDAESAFGAPFEKSPKEINLPSADTEGSEILPNVKDVVKTFEQKFSSLETSPLPARKHFVRADNEVDITYLGKKDLSQRDEILEKITGSAPPVHGAIMAQERLGSSLREEQVFEFSEPLVKKQKMSEINLDNDISLIDQNTLKDNKEEVVSNVTDKSQVADNANDFIKTICDKTEFPIEGTIVIDSSSFPMKDKEGVDLIPEKQDTDVTSIKEYKLKIYETAENERKQEVCLGNLQVKHRKDSVETEKTSDTATTIKRFPVTLPTPKSEEKETDIETKEENNKIVSGCKADQETISCAHFITNQLKLETFSRPPVPLTTTKIIKWTDEKTNNLETSDLPTLPKQTDFRITSERTELMPIEKFYRSENQNRLYDKAITQDYNDKTLPGLQISTTKEQTAKILSFHKHSAIESHVKFENLTDTEMRQVSNTDIKDFQKFSKPKDKHKSPLDIAKPVPHVNYSDESEEEFDKPKVTDMKQVLPLVKSISKSEDKDTKDVLPISKPEDKLKSPLDIVRSVPHVYSSDESEEEFDKPKLTDMKEVLPLLSSISKPEDKSTKDVLPISKPENKLKSPLDIVKPVPHVYSSDESEEEFDKPKLTDMKEPVPHVYSSDESEEEFDKPKLTDMKQVLPLVSSISKPEDKQKFPLDRLVPHVHSSDESEEEFGKPKLTDMTEVLPLVSSISKPEDKSTKDLQPISKPEDKQKSPLDRLVPHVHSSDESEEEFDKPKLTDIKQVLPLVSSISKPEDKSTKDVLPISKPEDKLKSPLDIVKPVPHVYSSDESEEEFDKPKLTDIKQVLPLVSSISKPEDKSTKDVLPISKPEDKLKSPLDIVKPVPHVYSSDESEEEFDKPKLTDMKEVLPLLSSISKPEDKSTKDVLPISKPEDKLKSPLDIVKPVPHVYSSDESEEEFDKPKLTDIKQVLPLVSSISKPEDKSTKDVLPISKPEDKLKSPLDIVKPVPHVYSSDESEEEFDKPKLTDIKQVLPLVSSISKPEDKKEEFDKPKLTDMKEVLSIVSSISKPEDKSTKDVLPISKPEDKLKSPLDIVKPVPHVYSSDESEEEFDKPKLTDMKEVLPLLSSISKPEDKSTKDVLPISKPEDKLKSPLDIVKPVPHVYSSDESEEEFDKPKLTDMKEYRL